MIHIGVVLYVFDWSVIPRSLPVLLGGLGFTARISIISLLFAISAGLLVALCRLSPIRAVKGIGYMYVQIFRALSLYVYILWIYFGIPAFLHINLSPVTAAVISLGLLNSAYMAEIYRSAIQAIDVGQWEASFSLGIGAITTFATVILPQAWRIAVPSLVNQFVDIIKDSSIVATVGAGDLMFRTIVNVSLTSRPFEFYTVTGITYLLIVWSVAQFAAALERRLKAHLM